ncbi:condensin complex subunit 2 [Cicer arietinum]|uniref:Condensin complex subunit 2 n=1 Tax=Cicer arietinum TaxID=3827 RepID=A0A1S2YKR1_CICAR|nr:condensin complex subunit 2 isoform X1 [Cicer arietinum]XP_012572819.1 condensin complex subunit 2 isoform X3 [Cicer arietinum]XP_027191226.1 condensin complex subunit 2 isoform X2 [Cicer arietinum]
MEETLSPTQKQRLPVAARIQSPTSPFLLGSNDDQLERAQARAARAAAIRRKNLTVSQSLDADSDPFLNKQQIFDLFQNCIKLASENKINQKNTWELNLIDHLTDIIKAEEENDTETNFQKASCTLEAGVKIYSLRVDSVHSEAYKVLGGMNRAGQEDVQDTTLEGVNVETGKEGSRKETDKKLSPLSTLEPSFEVLNVKKFDAAFVVDPLYRQTTAKFDEGGAKGLLMNNLGVYGGCKVLFDSLEVPANCMASQNEHDTSETIDLSFARDCVEQMVLEMRVKDEISPTLRTIVNQFDENNKRPTNFQLHSQNSNSVEELDVDFNCENGAERDEYENCATWNDDDHDDQTVDADLGSNDIDPSFPSYPQENEQFPSTDPDMDDRFENVDGFLSLSLGFSSKQNAWAGPDHWKYKKSKVSEVQPTSEDGATQKTRHTKSKRQAEIDLDFTNSLEKNMLDIFAPPKNPKTLLLPESRAPCNTKLPEDCHYQPEELIKLFLLPDVKCLGRRVKRFSDADGSREQCNENDLFPSWDNGSACGDESGDYGGDHHSDMEDIDTLITQPRQVSKIEVQYDKTSKQVDVQALKITLWDHVQASTKLPPVQGQEEIVSFKNILANFPGECNAAANISDISPHLCFICLLHLANEKGLSIHSFPDLDDLSIRFPHVGDAISETVV